jgi:hypothetical protein
MLFNLNRWVELTAGADPLPAIGTATPVSVIAAVLPQVNGADNGFVRSVIGAYQVYPPTDSRTTMNVTFAGDSFWHLVVTNTSPANIFYTSAGTVNALNRRTIIGFTYNGTINTVASTKFLTNSLRRPSNMTSANAFAVSPVANPITIGRRAGPNFQNGRFVGYMRSVELIIGRVLTDAELRRAFNFGTAHAAGLITPQDISIDFNRINGQAPICRPGSRQLTVTPYNNTTPDVAGTTYADFYSL